MSALKVACVFTTLACFMTIVNAVPVTPQEVDGIVAEWWQAVPKGWQWANNADAVIFHAGVRQILGLLGMFTLILGVWYADRTWDEKGSAAYSRALAAREEEIAQAEAKTKAENSRRRQEHDKARADAKQGACCAPSKPEPPPFEPVETDNLLSEDVTIPQAELDAAFPFPYAFILGWTMVAASYMFSCELEHTTELDLCAANIVSAVMCLIIGGVASVPMADAVKNRKAGQKRILSMVFVGSWIVLAVFSGFDKNFALRNGGLPLAFCLFGAVMIIFSMMMLWKNRKMGDSWEQEGKPNSNPVVYNFGGPTFIFGFFLFFVGQAQMNNPTGKAFFDVDCGTADCGIPLFFNLRTLLAFIGGCGMVPVVLFLDFAHDEGAEFVGFGTDGRYWGRFLETPIPFISMWTLFGLAGFLTQQNDFTLGNEPRTWVVLVLCIFQGITAGVLIQTALYKGDMAGKNFYSVPFLLMFITLGVSVGFSPDFGSLNAGGLAMFLGLVGAALIVLGQMTVFGDRKRGDYFMLNEKKNNPNPIVYSWGEPLFMTGWIVMSWAMSIQY